MRSAALDSTQHGTIDTIVFLNQNQPLILSPPLPHTTTTICALVLKCIETAKIRWPKRGFDFDRQMGTVLKENMPLTAQSADERFDERKKDHLSHFILRLAYCKSEDLRRYVASCICNPPTRMRWKIGFADRRPWFLL